MGTPELLLDTNAFIGMMHETAQSLTVLPRVASLSISVITLGELHAGAANSTR